jgi:uncharacterized protein
VKYRAFGRTGTQVSVLGFGCMRLPIIDEDAGQIDENLAIPMIRHAIDNGVNYIDTAYPYHKGTSEAVTGRALKDGYREKVFLATKLPIWLVESVEDTEKYLNEQLERLDTDCIDFYLVHSLNTDSWERTKKYDVLSTLEKARAQGKIKHIGFSFHDRLAVFKEIVDSYPWDFTQIQLNYMDENYQAGVEGMKYAHDKGLGIVVMEPLRGGKLVRHIPEDIMAIWEEANPQRSPAEWALHWVFDHPEVSVVLSGMTTLPQVDENILVSRNAAANSLKPDELDLIGKVRDMYVQKTKVLCTDCGYCLPCPEGVAIPSVFGLYNDAAAYATSAVSRRFYGGLVEKGADASRCVACGACLPKCPQAIEIIDQLVDAHRFLTEEEKS